MTAHIWVLADDSAWECQCCGEVFGTLAEVAEFEAREADRDPTPIEQWQVTQP